ncbi:plasmid pRiA4b ORF-3 family protein [Gordonia sp. CPCC 205515]|uniref:plasmid pRiA4b ORF-3 family protein n=1 Tax=Gordonia sp. CPCC 205515 TaxID=3140791 RepID=UPI003AF39D99
MTGDPSDARPQFEVILGGQHPSQIGQDPVPEPPQRGHFRKSPLPSPYVFRVRVELDDAEPSIWRTLELRSEMTLDLVHRAIQGAFGWLDYHLYRFALGGDPFGRTSELFLCDFDYLEGDDGEPALFVQLDETMHDPGDVLTYVYDYGDHWALTLRLESVVPLTHDAPLAICVDGDRAAPPEDCGHLTSAEELAAVVADPAHFDLAAVNTVMTDPVLQLPLTGAPRRLDGMLYRLQPVDTSGDLSARAQRLLDPAPHIAPEQLSIDLAPYFWFLERAQGEGIPLTAAGYLKPADVIAACETLPRMGDWIGAKNRENQSGPLLHFRESLQRFGLLRKTKGYLHLTKAGAKLIENPVGLANHLAQRLLPKGKADAFSVDATMLILFYGTTSDDGELPMEHLATLLAELDYRVDNEIPPDQYDVRRIDGSAYDILADLSPARARWNDPLRLSPTAMAIARAALTGWPIEQ